jgi:hypothetical protein
MKKVDITILVNHIISSYWQLVAEVLLTGVAPLGTVSYRFDFLNLTDALHQSPGIAPLSPFSLKIKSHVHSILDNTRRDRKLLTQADWISRVDYDYV